MLTIIWGLGIGDWGLGQSPNPHKSISSSQNYAKFILFQSIKSE
jgi:hypothetical protein